MKSQIFFYTFLILCFNSCGQNHRQSNKQNTLKEKTQEEQVKKPKYMDQVTETVLKMNIELERCYSDYIIEQELPYSSNEKLIVIPEFETLEDEYHFELNTHIAIIDSKTGKIKNKYFESSKTNGWVSNMIKLSNITIDTTFYKVSENKTAFAIKTSFIGQSKANPYDYDIITLFVSDKDSIVPILKNFMVLESKGVLGNECNGRFTTKKCVLTVSNSKTNNYFDINIKQTTINSTTYKSDNGDCDEKEESIVNSQTLKFVNGKYK